MLFLKKLLNIHFSATTFSANLNKWRFGDTKGKNFSTGSFLDVSVLEAWLKVREELFNWKKLRKKVVPFKNELGYSYLVIFNFFSDDRKARPEAIDFFCSTTRLLKALEQFTEFIKSGIAKSDLEKTEQKWDANGEMLDKLWWVKFQLISLEGEFVCLNDLLAKIVNLENVWLEDDNCVVVEEKPAVEKPESTTSEDEFSDDEGLDNTSKKLRQFLEYRNDLIVTLRTIEKTIAKSEAYLKDALGEAAYNKLLENANIKKDS